MRTCLRSASASGATRASSRRARRRTAVTTTCSRAAVSRCRTTAVVSHCVPPTCSINFRSRCWRRADSVGWALIGMAFVIWLALVILFTPRIDYRVSTPIRPDSEDFRYVIQSTCQAQLHYRNKVKILTDGSQFYPAMRDAILAAESSINLEAYIF